jgi:hypothetical protein
MFCDQKCLEEGRQLFHDAECATFDNFHGQHYGTCCLIVNTKQNLAELLSLAGSIDRLRVMIEPKRGSVEHFDWTQVEGDTDSQKKFQMLRFLRNSPAKFTEDTEDSDDELIEQIRVNPFFLRFIKSESDVIFLKKCLTRIFLLSRQNNAFIGENRGCGIWIYGSLFNHSCDPNVGKISFGNKIAFIVLQPIRTGHQLFIDYIYA